MSSKSTEAECYTSLLANLRMAEEASYALGHLYKSQDTSDFDIGQGFLAIGEMLKLTQVNVTNIATKTIRQEGGFR